MRIAVIDDLKSDRQLLISRLNKLLSDNSINGEIYEFEKGIDFINASKQTAFEVAFMDIYIDKENGIEISKLRAISRTHTMCEQCFRRLLGRILRERQGKTQALQISSKKY